MPFDEEDRVQSAYGKNYERLLVLKRKYDPGEIFSNAFYQAYAR